MRFLEALVLTFLLLSQHAWGAPKSDGADHHAGAPAGVPSVTTPRALPPLAKPAVPQQLQQAPAAAQPRSGHTYNQPGAASTAPNTRQLAPQGNATRSATPRAAAGAQASAAQRPAHVNAVPDPGHPVRLQHNFFYYGYYPGRGYRYWQPYMGFAFYPNPMTYGVAVEGDSSVDFSVEAPEDVNVTDEPVLPPAPQPRAATVYAAPPVYTAPPVTYYAAPYYSAPVYAAPVYRPLYRAAPVYRAPYPYYAPRYAPAYRPGVRVYWGR